MVRGNGKPLCGGRVGVGVDEGKEPKAMSSKCSVSETENATDLRIWQDDVDGVLMGDQ